MWRAEEFRSGRSCWSHNKVCSMKRARRAIGIARNFREALAESQEVSCLEHTTGTPLRPVYKLMGDPRNIAHAKKVTQEKHHKAQHAQNAGASQPGKKAQVEKTKSASI